VHAEVGFGRDFSAATIIDAGVPKVMQFTKVVRNELGDLSGLRLVF
jgi:hypothetical protein